MVGEPELVLGEPVSRVIARIRRNAAIDKPKVLVRPEAVWPRHRVAQWNHEIHSGLLHVPAGRERELWDLDKGCPVISTVSRGRWIRTPKGVELRIKQIHQLPKVAGGTV